MRHLPWLKHPFPLLLQLEWVLLGIAALTAFSNPFAHRYRRALPLPETGWGSEHLVLGVLLCVILVGILGLWLPYRKPPLAKILFTALGFGLCWLTFVFGRLGGNSFPVLLLIVVVRACLLFPRNGRLLTAALAFSSYFLRQLLGIRRFFNPDPAHLDRLPPSLSPDQLQMTVVNLMLSSTVLFGLVLAFVVIMVGALLTERQSREHLTLANQRLQRYALLIEDQATLQERNRIAREIHDSVGHTLTAQSIQLENVAVWLPQNRQRAEDYLAKARHLGKEALRNVRQSVATMGQPSFQGAAFTEAVHKLVQDFEANTGISTHLQNHLNQELSSDIALTLYRILQEALTNIAKHSQASQVSLSLSANPQAVQVVIQDNGQGFDPRQNTTGFGLQSMQERTAALGGLFTLSSQPGAGCRIRVTIFTGGQVG